MVLPTIMPSILRARATPTMSSRSPSDKIRRDLEQHRRRTRTRRDPVAGLDDAREQIVERGRALQFAQARRVGRGNVDRDVACDRRELLDQPDIVGGAVAGLLVGPDIDADDAARAGACRKPRQRGRRAVAVEAEPVDHGLVRLPGERFAAADCRAAAAASRSRSRRSRSRGRSSASGTSACLSKPGAIPTGLGKLRPKARTSRRESPTGTAATGAPVFRALMVSEWASSGSSARSRGRAKRSKKPINARSDANAADPIGHDCVLQGRTGQGPAKAIIPIIG